MPKERTALVDARPENIDPLGTEAQLKKMRLRARKNHTRINPLDHTSRVPPPNMRTNIMAQSSNSVPRPAPPPHNPASLPYVSQSRGLSDSISNQPMNTFNNDVPMPLIQSDVEFENNEDERDKTQSNDEDDVMNILFQEQRDIPLPDAYSSVSSDHGFIQNNPPSDGGRQPLQPDNMSAEPPSPFIEMISRQLSAIHSTLERIEASKSRSSRRDNANDKFSDDEFADDEEDEPDEPPRRVKIGKRNNGWRPRAAEHNRLHAAIRSHTAKLMKRQNKHAPLPPPPSSQEIQWFIDGDENFGPSTEDFVIDYNGSPTTPWNQAATDIFVQDFMETGWSNVEMDEQTIIDAWKSHIATLRKKYRDSVRYREDELAEVENRSISSRNRRRLTLYYRRLQACKRHPDLQKHTKILRELGPAGMSSDESTIEDAPTSVYVILKKAWRSDAVTLWLRDMDGVHLSLRVTESGRIERGNWPHERRESTRLSARNAIRGLPTNFYDSRWLNGLSNANKAILKVTGTHYELAHTDNVARIAFAWRGVTGMHNAPKL